MCGDYRTFEKRSESSACCRYVLVACRKVVAARALMFFVDRFSFLASIVPAVTIALKEPVDIVWTELPPRREKRPNKREGGWARQAEAIHPQSHSSLNHRHFK